MVTITFEIKPYLAKYMYGRHTQYVEYIETTNKPLPIHLSHVMPVYQTMYQLTVPHPKNAVWRETGNITFVLPHPWVGKKPEKYNYLSIGSVRIIEKEIDTEMRMELFEFLLDNKFNHGITFKHSMETFIEKYRLEEFVEEASMMKAFQRWRKLVREERKEESFVRD